MKNLLFGLTIALLFMGALLLSFSTNSKGSISLIRQANASGVANNTWQAYFLICPNGHQTIVVCGAGGSGCLPVGTCNAL